MGRPTKLTPVNEDRFFQSIAAGAYPEVAARVAGFSPASLYRYLRGTRPEHLAFRERLDVELAKLEVRLGGTLVRAALDNPRWAAFFLERRFWNRWAPGTRTDVDLTAVADADEPGGTTIIIDPAHPDDLMARLLQAGQHLWSTSSDVDIDAFEDRGADDEAVERAGAV